MSDKREFGQLYPFFPVQYNTVDKDEQSSNILRAEAMALATPLTSEYADKFYYSLKNIEMMCYNDMQTLCPSIDSTYTEVSDPLLLFFGPPIFHDMIDSSNEARKLTESIASSLNGDGLQMLKRVRDMFLIKPFVSSIQGAYSSNEPFHNAAQTLNPHENMANTGPALYKPITDANEIAESPQFGPPPVAKPLDPSKNRFITSLRGKAGIHELSKRSREFDERRKLHNGVDFKHHSDSLESDTASTGTSNESENHSDCGHGGMHHGHVHDESHQIDSDKPDRLFTGALGYGASRDLCLYENLNKVSSSCQDAVVAHYRLRDEYVNMSQAPCSLSKLLILLFVLTFVFFIAKRSCFGRRHHKVKALLNAIRSNTSLKATVEAETGLKVPEKNCSGHNCFRIFVLIILSVLSAIMIGISSVLFTIVILTWTLPPPSDDVVKPTSVPFAVFVLTSVCIAEVSLFFAILRGCKKMGNVGESNTENGPNVVSFKKSFSWFPTMFLRSNETLVDGYTPLAGDEPNREMQSELVTLSSCPPHTEYVIPVTPYAPYTGVTVTTLQSVNETKASAQPMSFVRMI